MKLLIINDYGMHGGGTETRIRLFVEELLKQKKADEIHILQQFQVKSREEDNGISQQLFFHTLKKRQSPYLIAKKIIKKYKITLLQAHNLLAIKPYVLLAAKQAGIPVVWWAHDYWLLCAKRSFIDPYTINDTICPKATSSSCNRCMKFRTEIKHFLWKKIICLSDLAIAPSLILQNIHENNRVLQGKWRVITPWIDPLFLKNHPVSHLKDVKKQRNITLLFVSSLIPFKGAWVAVRALKAVAEKYPNVQLLFVGDAQEKENSYRKQLESIAEQDGTAKCLFFLGKNSHTEISQLYAETDLYLCPTVCMESFGLNWAEAMSAGIPVIASSIGSIPEYITSSQNGILFPPRDHDALATKILQLLSNQKLYGTIRKNGMTYARTHFSSADATTKILQLYDQLLAEKRKRGTLL